MAGAGGLEMLCSEVIAASPFGILVHDAEGKILLFNARLEEITGYTASEVPDISTWLRLISPTDEYRQIWLDEPSNDIVPGVPRVRESMITRRDGLKEICRFHSACQLSGLRIVFIQPIEKLDAQQQTEPAFREIIDMLPETVYEMDPTGRILFLNRNGYERFGVTREDIERGFYPIDMLIPEDRVRARQSLEGVLSGKYRGPNEYTAILKDGRRVSHLAHSRPIVRDGNIAGSRGLIIDTTARRETEACLRENEERLRLAVEAAQIGIYTTDLETDRRHWSAEMYAIAGQPPGSIRTDEEAWSIVHPEDRERVLDIHRRALDPAGDGNFYSEHRIVRPNGEVRWIAWRGCTYFREASSGKVPIRRIGACIDITDRKLAENALKRSENKFSKMFNATPPPGLP